MKALEAKDFVQEGHTDRLRHVVVGMAKALDLPDKRPADLGLLVRFHRRELAEVGRVPRVGRTLHRFLRCTAYL